MRAADEPIEIILCFELTRLRSIPTAPEKVERLNGNEIIFGRKMRFGWEEQQENLTEFPKSFLVLRTTSREIPQSSTGVAYDG